MTSMLPPTRDLPPGRHTRIRAELERAVSGRRRSSRLTVPILAAVAAAAAVAVVATGVVLSRPGPVEHTPAVHITTSPTSTPAVRDTFGLTPEQIATIEQGCAGDAKETDKATLHNYGQDESGRWALLYTDKAVMWCDIGRGGREYSATQPRQLVHLNWLAGNYIRDTGGAYPGGDTHPFRPKLAGVPGVRILAGRADSSVARMTYRQSDGVIAEAKIANGTFVIRVLYPSTWSGGGMEGVTTELHAYDAAGNLLDVDSDSERKCWTMPGTNEVLPDRRPIEMVETATMKCQPAPPWR